MMSGLSVKKQKRSSAFDRLMLILSDETLLKEERKNFQNKVAKTKKIDYIILFDWISQDKRFKEMFKNSKKLTFFQKKRIIDILVTKEQRIELEEILIEAKENSAQSIQLKYDFNNCKQMVELCLNKRRYTHLLSWITIWITLGQKEKHKDILGGKSKMKIQDEFQEIFQEILGLIIHELLEIYPYMTINQAVDELRKLCLSSKYNRSYNRLKDKKILFESLEEIESFIGNESAGKIVKKQLS